MIKGTGRIKDPEDERDHLWRASVQLEPLELPTSYALHRIGPVLDQGQTSQCVAFTSASVKASQEYKQHRHYYRFDEPELYTRCKERDGIPNEDGTFARIALQVMLERGIWAKKQEHRLRADKLFAIAQYVRLTTIREIKEAVYVAGPVMLGMNVDDGWSFRNVVGGRIPEPSNNLLGGHEFAVYGWNDQFKILKIKNSWGVDWGSHGLAWLPYSHLDAYPDWDAWKAVDA